MRARKPHSDKVSTEKGSALLISLMVMVGLSLLGLGFVAISETESAIAVNERNALEAQAAAETGARLAMEWFQSPDWALDEEIMPTNDGTYPNVKITRYVDSYSGVYKPGGSDKLCDKPYKPGYQDRFYGTEDAADMIVDTATAATIIDNINTKLFGASTANPRITSIRIYAPPISGATLQADPGDATKQFWAGGTRYGVATIAATASKFDRNNTTAISSKVVRIVVGEFPTPVPAGPIQSASGTIDYGGSSEIHWGQKLSAANLVDTSGLWTVLPWANPYELAHFERGYDGTNYPPVPLSPYDEADYLGELVNKTYTDPWFGTRAVGNNTKPTCCTVYEPYYAENTDAYSAFTLQNANDYPNRKRVTFPVVDFDFWRRVALQGRGTKGIYYFKFFADSTPASMGGLFKRNGSGAAQNPAYWANANGGANLGGGLYFFDTRDGTNPQTAATPQLTPDIAWSSGDLPNGFLMKGFIYLNAGDWRITGVGSPLNANYLMPGEPFRDIGYRSWSLADDDWATDPVTSGPALIVGAADGKFSYQEMNDNGRFDVVTVQRVITPNDSGSETGVASGPFTVWVPKVWGPGCTVPPANWNGSTAVGTTCSEPHEPYLNMLYPAARTGAVTVNWEANNAQTQSEKTATACPGAAGNTVATQIPDQCTSNAYDKDGALVPIPAIVDGLVYNEGDFSTQGNSEVYGAVLAGGLVDGTGNLTFWFKEALTRGDHVPPGAPRVIPYSIQTDDVDD